jgi:hypothetical protein
VRSLLIFRENFFKLYFFTLFIRVQDLPFGMLILIWIRILMNR